MWTVFYKHKLSLCVLPVTGNRFNYLFRATQKTFSLSYARTHTRVYTRTSAQNGYDMK